MDASFTRGGLLVGLAIVGVVLYEVRTLAEFVGVGVPLLPYMLVVVVVLVAAYVGAVMTGRLDTDGGAGARTP
ncbi:MAG: CbaC protein [Halobacteriota archaeon]